MSMGRVALKIIMPDGDCAGTKQLGIEIDRGGIPDWVTHVAVEQSGAIVGCDESPRQVGGCWIANRVEVLAVMQFSGWRRSVSRVRK